MNFNDQGQGYHGSNEKKLNFIQKTLRHENTRTNQNEVQIRVMAK